jgi:hypothetical protein
MLERADELRGEEFYHVWMSSDKLVVEGGGLSQATGGRGRRSSSRGFLAPRCLFMKFQIPTVPQLTIRASCIISISFVVNFRLLQIY